MSGLSGLCLEEGEARDFAPDLAQLEIGEGSEARTAMHLEVLFQVPIQALETHDFVAVPQLARDLQPEQASQGILKDAEVTCVHRIDGNVLDGESWAPEDGRRLGT